MIVSKKIFFLLYCIIFLMLKTHAQQDAAFTTGRTITGNFSYFTIDNLDNIYLLTNTNQLKKITPNGDSAIFNDVYVFPVPQAMINLPRSFPSKPIITSLIASV